MPSIAAAARPKRNRTPNQTLGAPKSALDDNPDESEHSHDNEDKDYLSDEDDEDDVESDYEPEPQKIPADNNATSKKQARQPKKKNIDVDASSQDASTDSDDQSDEGLKPQKKKTKKKAAAKKTTAAAAKKKKGKAPKAATKKKASKNKSKQNAIDANSIAKAKARRVARRSVPNVACASTPQPSRGSIGVASSNASSTASPLVSPRAASENPSTSSAQIGGAIAQPTTRPSPLMRLRTSMGRAARSIAHSLSPARVFQGISTSPSNQSDAASTLTGTDTSSFRTQSTLTSVLEADGGKSIQEDYQAKGDGGDSDEEGEEADIHHSSIILNRPEQLDRTEVEEDVDPEDKGIPGAPEGWIKPGPPDDWQGYSPKTYDDHEPSFFEDVDNPGCWSDYTFQAKYNNGQYDGHFTPCGAKVVPEDDDGFRMMNDWEFHYDGWTPDEFDQATYARVGAKYGDIRPKSRRGNLDVRELTKQGLTATRVKDDPLFFFQLLFPICDPTKSGIADDGRMPFFTHARMCTNTYAFGEKGWGGAYGHDFKPTNEVELVKWLGATVRHGARKGGPGSLHTRWDVNDPDYDEIIASNITASRFKEIKPVWKLNNNLTSPKRGLPGYDPCAKYDYIYRSLCHNMNYLTGRADPDFGIDETTWGYTGYGSESVKRLIGKKVPKGKRNSLHSIMRYQMCCLTLPFICCIHRWADDNAL